MPRMNADSRRGFNLVEMAIVLVLVGVLIGAVLAARGILDTTRKQKLVRVHDQLALAVIWFYEKCNGLPGDENDPNYPDKDPVEGNRDRLITLPDPEQGLADERNNTLQDLALAGLIELPPDSPYLRNSFGGTVSIMVHARNKTGDARAANYMAFSNIPGKIIAEIDQEKDNGRPDSGDILAGIMPNPEDTVIIGRFLDYNSTFDQEAPATLYWLLRW